MTDLSRQDWLRAEETQQVMTALQANAKEARFVGGCVRDALIGRTVHDIDIATVEHPEVVLKLLEVHGIKAIPTGIDHGTVTAVCGGKPFEITTLRADVETDGRRAVVAFTEDWLEDAQRRDFTFNAMSVDITGTLYDPFNGLDDLKAGRVRFVGRAEERIREDYLRILRFFRFNAHFGKGPVDQEALSACTDLAEGIKGLSGERIAQEFLRLLEAPRPAKWISIMKRAGVSPYILKDVQDVHNLEMLCAFEDAPDRIRRLAVLLPKKQDAVEEVCQHLRLSNKQKKRLLGARCADAFLIPSIDENGLRSFLFKHGAQRAEDHVFLYWAEKGFTGIGPKEQQLLDEIKAWRQAPVVFPLQGKDLLELGLMPGPELGRHLGDVQDWWCAGGCHADKAACLSYIKQQLGLA